jgi:hypothetical protein
MPACYPKRPSHFSHRFLRVLFKSCAALELGQGAVCLLAAIVNVEDAKRYAGPAGFWNGNLAQIAGFRSEDALATARKRAIDAGWLHYEPGGKHRIGRYWVQIPEGLDHLDDTPLGESVPAESTAAPAMAPVSTRSSAGQQRSDSGDNPPSSGLDPLQRGPTAVRQRFESGSTAEHSTLSLPLPLTLIPERAAASPTLDPDEQDITTPSASHAHVPRRDVPRAPGNDIAPAAKVTGTTPPERALNTWVRWLVNSDERTEENRATLRTLAERYGMTAVQQAAEALFMRGDQTRNGRAPSSRCWPDELLPEILRQNGTQAPGATTADDPAEATTLPEIVRQAHALIAQHGDAEARTALGWSQSTAPTPAALRQAVEREALAQELVDAFAHGPLVIVPEHDAHAMPT